MSIFILFFLYFAKVDLFREITFRNSKRTYKGIPVMASNMDTVGTFEMAKALSKVCKEKDSIRKLQAGLFQLHMIFVFVFFSYRSILQHGLFTTVHKYYTAEEWKDFAMKNSDCLGNIAVSSGMGQNDFERLLSIIAAVPELSFICLDVANGYSQHFVEFVRKVRAQYPSHTIIVS